MDLIIVDRNFNYARSLKHFLENTSSFVNISIFRDLRELNSSLSLNKGILLFEINPENILEFQNNIGWNKNLIIIGHSTREQNNTYSELFLNGVSSIISKTDKLEIISEEIQMIISGKRILSKRILEEIKQTIPKQTSLNQIGLATSITNFFKRTFNKSLMENKK